MNQSEFQQVISQTSKPLVVDFWAPWCAPCRMAKPILEELAREFADQVDFIPINANDSRELVRRLRILGIPTVLAFQNGVEAGRITGAQKESDYRAVFEALARGSVIKVPLWSFDRMLRLGAGLLLVGAGISTSSWLLISLGGLLAFLGIYDRCPLWRAFTGGLRRASARKFRILS